ncbi:MAG: NTF2 fold immunity protein [Bacteroidales bacterium]
MKTKICLCLLISAILLSCVNNDTFSDLNNNLSDSINYKTLESKNFFPISITVDENGNFIDSIIPPLLKSIRSGQNQGFKPKSGLVNNPITAKRIGLAVLESIYGKAKIKSEEPIHIALIDDKIWFITGSLSKGYDGGVAEILISKEDGRIYYVGHGK